jgi:uracil-DNA glycosylase
VIVGQDPYHGVSNGLAQANGLAFSVNRGVPPPPSLVNIFDELNRDSKVRFDKPEHGDLTMWAKQGVLLLNTSLTVRKGNPGSHTKKGWEEFTDGVIRTVNHSCDHVIFMLWGNHAQSKKSMIDIRKHLVLTTSHPSPYSADRGFKGCGHFSRANAFLSSKKKKEIDWNAINTQSIPQ